MQRRLCAAILSLEAIALGLGTPVLISVAGVSTATALWIGLGLTVACILVAGLLRFPWAYGLGWAIQVVAIALGFQVTAMFFLGASSSRCGPRRTSWAARSSASARSGSAPGSTPACPARTRTSSRADGPLG